VDQPCDTRYPQVRELGCDCRSIPINRWSGRL